MKKNTEFKQIIGRYTLFITLFFFSKSILTAQNTFLSEEYSITRAEAYGVLGKMNDRVLFFVIEDNQVKIRALDSRMRKIWEREIEPERRQNAKVLELVSQNDAFSFVYQYRKKGHDYIKIHRYDPQVKLLDSLTIMDWGHDILSPNLIPIISENRRKMLLYEPLDTRGVRAIAVNLDSMKVMWESIVPFEKGWSTSDEDEQSVVFTNNGEAFFIKEADNNSSSIAKHRFEIQCITADSDVKTMLEMPHKLAVSPHFSYDNTNKILIGTGAYQHKIGSNAQGIFFVTLPPPQYQAANWKFYPFEEEFLGQILGKKVNDVKESKGLPDVKIQSVVHRRDGGILAVLEQQKSIARTAATNMGRSINGQQTLSVSYDYYYDNIAAFMITPEGTIEWRSICHKKQVSQDDNARYSSFFVSKTAAELRFFFNDEIERETTVSEFVLDGNGTGIRHTVFNTEGLNLWLRLKDATQVAANELIVPSDDRRYIRIVKIMW